MHSENNNENCGDFDSGEFESQNSEKHSPPAYDVRDYHPSDPRATGRHSLEEAAKITYPHGRSQKFILRHESPVEYEALHKKWWDEYQPSCHIEEALLQLLVDNHWLFKRARLRLEQVEWELPINAKHWIESARKQVETFTRFKNTAERVFQRSFREVELHFRECVRAENTAYKAELMRLKIEAEIARKPEAAKLIVLKMITPLYADRRARAAARANAQPMQHNSRADSPEPGASPPHACPPFGRENSGEDS